jgi:TM2 domain-containing membrane protein YozV
VGLILVMIDLFITILARLTSFPVRVMTFLMSVIYFPWSMVSIITNAAIYLPLLLFACLAYFLTGTGIARLSGGNVRAASLAGLLAGLVLGLCDLLISTVILFAETLPAINQSYPPAILDATRFNAIRDTFLYTFSLLVLALLLGAGIAYLGGLRGKRSSDAKRTHV